jgi:delta 1-pyrroline-5-carboxylate dehydrogenase
MRAWTLPAVMAGVLVMTGSDEPTETAMRAAFEARLAAQVQSAVAFVAETGGAEALATLRAARTDEFVIRSFVKRDCAPSPGHGVDSGGHVCTFSVRIGVINGELDRTLKGRFYAGPSGLVLESDDAAAAGV